MKTIIKLNRHKRLWKKFLRRKKRIRLCKRKKNISNRALGVTNAEPPKTYIQVPSELSFGSNWENVIETLNQIKHSIRYAGIKRTVVRIDHSKMLNVTPSGILVLASTIERAQKLANVSFKGIPEYLPKDDVVRYLLNKIDYWKYFDVGQLETSITQERFSFCKIIDSYQADNAMIGKMVEFFSEQVGFNGDTKSLLFTALCEAAANSVEHGYNSSFHNQATDRWWLTAYIDKAQGSMSFVFYDQGMGIFNSLRNHKEEKVKKFFSRMHNLIKDKPNANILKQMVETNFSKYETDNRGYGVQTFKHFIDEAKDGLLFIASENASYEYPNDTLKEYKNKLDGTLIVWKIKIGYDTTSSMYLKNGRQ